MPPLPGTRLPTSRIPRWERRREKQRWKWNGLRRGDPRLRSLTFGARPGHPLIYALAGVLAGVGILVLALL